MAVTVHLPVIYGGTEDAVISQPPVDYDATGFHVGDKRGELTVLHGTKGQVAVFACGEWTRVEVK